METDCSRDFRGMGGFLFWSNSYVELLAPAGCGALCSQPLNELGWHHHTSSPGFVSRSATELSPVFLQH